MPYFNKYPISKNFSFLEQMQYRHQMFVNSEFRAEITIFEDDILHIAANYIQPHAKLPHYSQINHTLQKIEMNQQQGKDTIEFRTHSAIFTFGLSTFDLKITRPDGVPILQSRPHFIGFSGEKSIIQFYKEPTQPFWGFGERSGGLNKENQVMKMWNIDLMSDLPDSYFKDTYDPTYVSIPFFITKTNGAYVGIFYDNPGETYFNTGKDTNFLKQTDDTLRPKFFFGSYTGEASLYICTGTTVGDVVRKFTLLAGRHELPPRWALGKHQCKWSYMNREEVEAVVKGYDDHKIPFDAIWLDIDYMDKFKVFTWNAANYGPKIDLASWLHDRQIRLVTIIDPGVKDENGYTVHDEGVEKNVFCKTNGGRDFVGHVWPGDTVFPDFWLPDTRDWWANKVADHVVDGVDGIWNDMNDPATASVDPEDMMFGYGTVEHKYLHNLYANYMAEATWQGLLQARPTERPFVLTRSGAAGIQKHAAVWTGDNVSNWEHLHMSVAQTINLGLSGVAFSGPDVGGFSGFIDEHFVVRWYEAGFLFPFLRNHKQKAVAIDGETGSMPQEPYVFSPESIDTIRRYMNLRYKLMPYMYNLFYEHTQTGTPVLRPLFYEFDDPMWYDCSDEFLLGPYLLQAPLLHEKNTRTVCLPEGKWFDWNEQVWIDGGCEIDKAIEVGLTPLYVRDGAVIPVLKGYEFHDPVSRDFTQVEFLVFAHDITSISYTYYEDDGISLEHQTQSTYNLHQLNINIGASSDLAHAFLHHQYAQGIRGIDCVIQTQNDIQTITRELSV